MKQYLKGIWFSLPIQLMLLHFRRYQIFLLFWYILFATVGGSFMKTFGAHSLFLAPEYFGNISPLSTAIVGITSGVFIMSWNITTFILHSNRIQFLATTAQPFLKYCINNAILPIAFLIFYLIEAYQYSRNQELFSVSDFAGLALGYTGGFVVSIAFAFLYFFGADKTIYKTISATISDANKRHDRMSEKNRTPDIKQDMRVDWFFSAAFKLRKPRNIKHYNPEFLEAVFSRHHFAAVIAIMIAFVFLILVGYSSDARLFQLPAAASVTLLFAILIAAAGALTLFLKPWSFVALVAAYIVANILYQYEILDPRNKAYGLNYVTKSERPVYTRESIQELAAADSVEKDKAAFLNILNNWKFRQREKKPILYIINTSGGGTRSATFTMNTLQHLDSLMNGQLMKKTILINGASGGMLGAVYFRELYHEKVKGKPINLQDKQYVNNISKDLLSPLFSSFLTRDMLGPAQKFTSNGFEYVKDRGYAFEEKLNENTGGVFLKTIGSYQEAEAKALIPSVFFNSVITRDARKMIIASRPVRFLMRPVADSTHIMPFDADAVDFNSFLRNQNSNDIHLLSALRMNATFPYVLPNVWLPTNPVIDVMDAGLRDNYGQESALRFIAVFKDWIQANTSKVVLIQIRDRSLSDWDKPLESNSLIGFLTKPFLILQNNWFKMQDYYQHDQLDYMRKAYGDNFYRFSFQYIPSKSEAPASLSFHLTAAEKRDIAEAVKNPLNQKEFERLQKTIQNAEMK